MSLTPTHELREELRRLVDERVLPGMLPSDTRFSDTEVDRLLSGATHIDGAAAEGWRLKASRAMSERDGLQEANSGDTKFKFVTIEAYRDHCLAMAAMHNDRAPGRGSTVLGYDMGGTT